MHTDSYVRLESGQSLPVDNQNTLSIGGEQELPFLKLPSITEQSLHQHQHLHLPFPSQQNSL